MRYLVRAAFGIAALGSLLFARADSPWRINDAHALFWQDAAYTPVGLRVSGEPADINAAAKLGLQDLCVDLPVAGDSWAAAFQALQQNHVSFLLSINSLANYADGYSIEPQGYRLTKFDADKPVTLSIPGASSVMALLVAQRDGEVLKTWHQKTPAGQFSITPPRGSGDDAILILYPRMQSMQLPDYYEGLDKQRDQLLKSLRGLKSTTGLRGIVNPLGAMVKLPAPDVQFVPSSQLFQLELARYLENKYRSLDTAEQTWSMRASDIDSFEKMARLVPLWSGTRGLQTLWDPTTDHLYPIDNKHSYAWNDIQDVINIAARRRIQRLTEAIHAVVQVPVIQEWAGWSIPYEGGAVVDGVGMQTQGSGPSQLLQGASRAASSVLRWDKPGWLVATRVDLTGARPEAVGDVLDDLFSVGARGAFIQSDDPAVRKAVAAASVQYRAGVKSTEQVRAFYFPENATFPAEPQRLPGGVWWLPAPYSGNRLLLGKNVQGYRFNDGHGDQSVYWVPSGELQVKLCMSDPKSAAITSIGGEPVQTKISKDGITVLLNTTPIVVSGTREVPIPDVSKEELVDHMAKILTYADENHVDISQQAYNFQVNYQGFDRNPGGSYEIMKDQFDQVCRRIGKFNWIEGETAQASTLGEGIFYPGCSQNSAFHLHTELNIPGQIYRCLYYVIPKSKLDQEVWIAANIPADLRRKVRVSVGTQVFNLPDPVAPYGLGFAWYHLGTTKIGTDRSSIILSVDGAEGAELALDVIILTPDPFDPYGVRVPDPMPFGDPLKTTKPGKKH